MCNSPYKGALDCATRLLRTEGPAAFYRSYTTTLAMNLPFASINFGVYDFCKNALGHAMPDASPAGVHLISGGIAGGVAAACTTPLDVIKTRLQTDRVRRSPWSVARTLLNEGGAAALFSGAGPRVAFHIPAVGICWATYEGFKSFLLPLFASA